MKRINYEKGRVAHDAKSASIKLKIRLKNLSAVHNMLNLDNI
jgi:hypothetical protein